MNRDVDLLISGGTVVTSSGVSVLDIAVQGERIVGLLSCPSGVRARREIDARGRLVLPGGVDPHVHFENPSMGTATAHDFGLGTVAAACGGTTTVIDFAFQQKGESPLGSLRRRREIADSKVAVDYGLHACITNPDSVAISEIPRIIEFGSPSFKILMVYREEGWIVEDGPMFDIMRTLAESGGMLGVHAENVSMVEHGIAARVAANDLGPRAHARSRPPIVEVEAIRRAIFLAEQTGCPLYIFHMTTAGGLRSVAEARKRGQTVHAETCPHYLLYNEEILESEYGYRYVMSPPLRPTSDRVAMWEGLADGNIEAVGTDDAAYFEKYKLRGLGDFRMIANGIPGVEMRMAALYSEGVAKGRISLERFVDAVATKPAQIFGLYPAKGAIAPGSDADIVIFDPDVQWLPSTSTLHTNIEYTCYEGQVIQGKVVHVWSRGRQVVESGRFTGDPGWGRFLERPLRASD